MPNQAEKAIHHKIETHTTPEGRPVEIYAGGKIRVYGGHTPRTIIDIRELHAHIIIHKFDPFEFNKENEVDHVLVRKDHHKSEYVVGFRDHENGVPYEYEAWSPDGLIGFAFGKRLDLFIASLFYTDPRLNELIKDAGMDENVREHLDFSLISAGKHKHTA